MRTKKAIINSSINIITYVLLFIPNLIIRKVFLDTLGNELLGLNSLYTNIIGWISIAELGIGSAIIYSLYKPFAQEDRKKINAYINFYGKFYRCTGFFILIVGISISPFIKFFIENDINTKIVTIGFIISLLNSFISYMFSHKLCILNVAQEAYKVTIGTTISQLFIFIFQYIILNNDPNFILFISVQLIVNLIYYIIINIYILNRYQWLGKTKESLDSITRKELFKNVKALFMHKIGNLVVNGTDNIVISKFIGLGVLSDYTNYNTVILALQRIVSMGLNGITSSVGNMLTDNDKKKAYDIHKKIFFLNFWIVSFIVISLYNTLNQFISLWVGTEYLLDNLTYIIILINLYFVSMRGSVEQFQNGSGNFYQDRYAPIVESIINLTVSIFLVKRIGIAGVFIGTLVSNFSVIFWTKPYVVYKYVFDKPLANYFKMYFGYLFVALIPLLITNLISNLFKFKISILSFIINCLINIVLINIIYIIIFFKTNEFKYYLGLVKNMINKFER
ncbi:lipopolysaccharide biosynthesis protein [uncultured Clostridium sp.]|uniref:lipopolysaccharide biosynthesis protein n=1 Tax=uncultured Clostridium sp. TaxID=59620 RepID=UPI0025D9ECF4|nr:O-unit flippase [uncultured Clostridium sp.]